MIRTSLVLALALGSSLSMAAPVVTVSTDATALANALRGSNPLTINSATLNGTADAGTFTDPGSTPIFFSSGIFLSTGVASCLPGPNNSSGCHGVGVTFSELLIDFTPSLSANSIGFIFQFGSEEFPEFVGSPFQDSFVFEVNGTNYAELTNGETVTIDNLWQSSDYIPNHSNSTELGMTKGTATIDNRTQLDGFSRKLAFVAPVDPGVSNSMRLFITDVSDSRLDSFVLLQAGTLQENPPPMEGVIPEPGTVVLMLGGLGALIAARGYRRSA